MADQIAASVKGTRRGVRSSWSPFTSKHPAVKAFNEARRDLDALRESYTIVRSAEVRTGATGSSIQGGVRLIWDQDIDAFHKAFLVRAKQLDAAAANVQFATDNQTAVESKGSVVPSIKAMDRAEAGDAWDESAYPENVTLTAGVAKERDSAGLPILDEEGNPKYVISFSEYHVSEKLNDTLRARAIERLDARMSETVETAFSHVVGQLNEKLATFMTELVGRVQIRPKASHPFYRLYCEHEPATVLRAVDHETDRNVPDGMVKLYLIYKGYREGAEHTTKNLNEIKVWCDPIPVTEYEEDVRPESGSETKRIHTSVIEDIFQKLQAFRDRQARMLGVYGTNALEAFDDLFETMNRARGLHASNSESADRLAQRIRGSEDMRQELGDLVAATIEKLDNQVEVVRQVTSRRTIRTSLIGDKDDE